MNAWHIDKYKYGKIQHVQQACRTCVNAIHLTQPHACYGVVMHAETRWTENLMFTLPLCVVILTLH